MFSRLTHQSHRREITTRRLLKQSSIIKIGEQKQYYICSVKKPLLLILVFVCSGTMSAQLLDSLRELFKHQYTIDARLESRNSFIDHQLISVNGVRLGVSFKRKLRMGGGVSWLNSEVRSSFLNNDGTEEDRFLKFVYLCYYMDFVFFKIKRWQLSVPIQAGTGLSWFHSNRAYSFSNRAPKYLLLLYEPGITAQYKVFKWFGVGADVAYRFALKNHRKTGEQLNSPTYSFKILFWFDQLYYDLFPDSEISKRFGPSYW